ncbi:unnamed protein product [Brassicogethes aeneus]|uniref:PHD-type domain-containing protein n=1 Tax=Brassicogethes aeneus TaxID=1431903 RepID=A0A9P0FMS7_BRAAE|nr:unnamed protein product [Brassicogethes aeneus]
MSGGPPHHPHGRQVPSSNSAWNHLQVPNFFPRQPQHAHMSNEPSLLHQPATWHTPTTEPIKPSPMATSHASLFQHLLQRPECFPVGAVGRTPAALAAAASAAPGVDLSLAARNGAGALNGEAAPPAASPISLSVRDTNKINSLVEMHTAVELTKCQKSLSPGLKSTSPGVALDAKLPKRSNIRVDSILERLNPNMEKTASVLEQVAPLALNEKTHERVSNPPEKTSSQSVIVQPSGSHDENSNSSGANLAKEEDNSNEDSLDGQKSRRKRKPNKTVRVSKDDEKSDHLSFVSKILAEENKIVERRRSSDDVESLIPAKTRRKTSSESETIDNIAAMVQECVKEKDKSVAVESKPPPPPPKQLGVIRVKDNLMEVKDAGAISDRPPPHAPVPTAAQKKATPTQFVEVENKLEEMFAGIEDAEPTPSPPPPKTADDDDSPEKTEDDPLLKLHEDAASKEQNAAEKENEGAPENGQQAQETNAKATKTGKRRSRPVSRRGSEVSSTETTPKKKKPGKKGGRKPASQASKGIGKGAKKLGQKNNSKVESIKDVYAYDSGSNASSSKSRGPFIQIKGPRDSPISVSVVNAANDDDSDKKAGKSKKFHDDTEYRHKVRSKGLHCSTLSNKYDAQTKDATWICAFCKRGPHATELSGPTWHGDVIPAGDLFGPYIITSECPEFERRLDDPFDRQFKSRKITKVLDETKITTAAKKGKRKLDVEDVHLGITHTESKSYEVWAHEDCIVWSAGVYLVGPKIVGLEEAIWTSCNVACKVCQLKGANVCCGKRGCLATAHLCCSRARHWRFDAETFKVFCPVHAAQ